MKAAHASLAMVAVALGACAGGGDDERLSAEQFRDRAAEICQSSERDVQRLGAPEGARPEQVASFFRDALGIARRRLREQEALRPPQDLEDEQARIVRIQRRGIDLVQDVIGRLEGGERPVAALREVRPQLERLQEQSDAVARRLGVEECVTRR